MTWPFPGTPPHATSQVTLLSAQWTDCPAEVQDEIRRLWTDHEFGNDNYYHSWDKKEDAETYPVIAAYLADEGIETCLIHWWW